MGNVTVPTPVALAGGAICLLGGYLVGVVVGPDSPNPVLGTVESYDASSRNVCLSGEDVSGLKGADDQGRLCGTWFATGRGSGSLEEGDEVRFVSEVVDFSSNDETDETDETDGAGGTDAGPATYIYGQVVE